MGYQERTEVDQASPWADRSFTNRDGLKLHYRDYSGPSDRPPILCLHGLTRNSRDFEDAAARYAGDWRVLTLDFRGRGLSDHDPDSSRYTPKTYAEDVAELLDEAGIDQAVFLGTSLGGIVTMIVAAAAPERIAGAMLNDIGPDVDPSGIERIRTYVGNPVQFRDFADAGQRIGSASADVHPAYGPAEWERFARRVCRQTDDGVEFDYDMAIADNFNRPDTDPVGDIWPFFRALSHVPLLVLRGERSDLLSDAGVAAMRRAHPDAEVVTVPGVGHAPDLSEPQAVEAIDRLLERVLRRQS